jgi:hypothetical protein
VVVMEDERDKWAVEVMMWMMVMVLHWCGI